MTMSGSLALSFGVCCLGFRLSVYLYIYIGPIGIMSLWFRMFTVWTFACTCWNINYVRWNFETVEKKADGHQVP